MGALGQTKTMLFATGRFINEAISFLIFCFLDLFDVFLCFAFKIVDFLIESEWKPCYCSSSNKNGKEAIIRSGKIFVMEQGESKIVRLSSTKLHLEEISDTLYSRPSLVSEVSKFTINEFKKLKLESTSIIQSCAKIQKNGKVRSTFTVNSTIVEMLQGKIGAQTSNHIPRWSDCHCKNCNSWSSSGKESLYVRAQGPKDNAREDVLFIHGFISSSSFWTETLFPNFSNSVKSTYRLIAIDLLGFGRSPKPKDSLYTLREHLDMIEKTVLDQHKVKSCHIVAHSLGCILALALAVKHPGLVKSLTLLAPPYFPVPKGERATQYVMRRIAPRRVWPVITFAASIACWYEHITRTTCVVLSKNHRLWEFLTKFVTRNRCWAKMDPRQNHLLVKRIVMQTQDPLQRDRNLCRLCKDDRLTNLWIKTFLLEGFFCHTHNAAWHTLHNIICGTAGKLDAYLDAVRDRLTCDVNIIHGRDDELIPLECSYHVQSKIPRARVIVIDNKDHITVVIGRQKDFARELEEIWHRSRG